MTPDTKREPRTLTERFVSNMFRTTHARLAQEQGRPNPLRFVGEPEAMETVARDVSAYGGEDV